MLKKNIAMPYVVELFEGCVVGYGLADHRCWMVVGRWTRNRVPGVYQIQIGRRFIVLPEPAAGRGGMIPGIYPIPFRVSIPPIFKIIINKGSGSRRGG